MHEAAPSPAATHPHGPLPDRPSPSSTSPTAVLRHLHPNPSAPESLAAEGEAAFHSDVHTGTEPHHAHRHSQEHIPHMDPIAEEGDRPSASQQPGPVPQAGSRQASETAAGTPHSPFLPNGDQTLNSSAFRLSPPSGLPPLSGGSTSHYRRMKSSEDGPALGIDGEADGLGPTSLPSRTSAPAPHFLAAADGARPKKPLLQRLSASFRPGGSASPSPRQTSPSADGTPRGGGVGGSVFGAGTGLGTGGAERSSLMQRMGSAIQRVSLSFRSQQPPLEAGALAAAGAGMGAGLGGGSPPGETSLVYEHHSQPTSAREGAGASSKADRSASRPLGACSVPVVQSYADGDGRSSRPDLRRRGCYAGLVGQYRMGTLHEGGTSGAASSSAASGAAAGAGFGAGAGPARSSEEEAQLSELKGWLHETTQPWKRHSVRLHRMQAHEALAAALQEAKEPKPVLPQAPPKPKLKTFSLAVKDSFRA